ncbi:hypothetical protein RIVERRIDER_73 [Xanthomonas phage RiverRider]|uniref:Uncharacterized protein n=1 Tax=Xanthomonas phage RiverRider TaxID=2108116 RepID=A0A2P1JUZ5_9CAUD|nr:hypothetical protein HWB58_gp62 [Xanthomonas phage RiverRider]AVO23154.1 hypothetical protein RIVERRIDER_73 [Xanthomonas phage RiverRider]
MGIFGSRKKTYVSSVVYNMAGDENERPSYLKTTVLGGVLNNVPSLGQTITNSYLNGPAIRFRSFARWSRRTGYTDTVGLVTGSISVGNSVDINVLKEQIPHAANQQVQVQSVKIGDADYTYWADRWMLENHPDQINEDWTADIEGQTIRILFNDVVTYSFVAADFIDTSRYLYATYLLANDPEQQPTVPGDIVVLAQGEPYPSTDGWEEINNSVVNTDVDLVTDIEKDVTYSDGRPAEHSKSSTTRTETYQEIHRVYMKDEFKGNKPDSDSTYSVESTMYQDQVRDVTEAVTVVSADEDIGGGVTKTTKTTTTTQNLSVQRSYRIDTQETIESSWSDAQVFIYRRGSGNAVLDAMFNPRTGEQQFFPFIPYRINNEFISPTNLPDVYEASKKALKKSTTGKYDDIIEKIKDNESLKDIDYAYSVFGVSLNVKEVACREYVYRFFKSILEVASVGTDGEYTAWKLAWDAADASLKQWSTWKAAQADSTNPLYGTPEPVQQPYPPMPTNEIKIRSDKNNVMNYNITISWNGITETEHTGHGRPGAKKGDLWFSRGVNEIFAELGYVGGIWGVLDNISVNDINLYWQDENDSYRIMNVRGLLHRNEIYKGKAVEIDAADALVDTDESGFIIPLHEGIYQSMPLTRSTQMATACSFIVFNCYQVVKKKWYQTGLFKVVLIIVIIIISIYTAGAGAAASAGILGSSAAVGAAIGLTGVAAIVVGAIANAIAAMILVSIIQRAAVALFGEKIGAIVAVIAAFVVLNVGTAMATGQSMASGFANMMRADNLLALTNTGLNAYTNYVNASTQDILLETQKIIEGYKVESEAIAQAYAEAFGVNKGVIDPLSLTEAARSYIPESPASFLERTLMVGSDIAGLSLDMLGNFSDLTLSTNLQT